MEEQYLDKIEEKQISSRDMCNNLKEFYIHIDDVKQMQEFLKHEKEICAPVEIKNGKLVVDYSNLIEGTTKEYSHRGVIKYRGSCSMPDKFVILHTHPNTSKPYPSEEDIEKVIKRYDVICMSLIVTSWGLWVISDISNRYRYATIDKKNLRAKLETWNYILYCIYKKKTPSSVRMAIEYDLYKNNIREYLKQAINTFKLNIQLYTWNELNREQNIIIL